MKAILRMRLAKSVMMVIIYLIQNSNAIFLKLKCAKKVQKIMNLNVMFAKKIMGLFKEVPKTTVILCWIPNAKREHLQRKW